MLAVPGTDRILGYHTKRTLRGFRVFVVNVVDHFLDGAPRPPGATCPG